MKKKYIIPLILSLTANSASAAESSDMRFMPLAPRAAGKNNIITPSAQFIPLAKSRFPMPLRSANPVQKKISTNSEPEEKILSTHFPEKINTGKKNVMPKEQAQQILSIFATAQ